MTALVQGGVTGKIIGAAIEVHRILGPGLLEGAYRECLLDELRMMNLKVERERPLPIVYKGHSIDNAYRADLIVEGAVLVELKAVDRLMPVHRAQTLSYLKLSGIRVGLLFNFNALRLKDEMQRFVR